MNSIFWYITKFTCAHNTILERFSNQGYEISICEELITLELKIKLHGVHQVMPRHQPYAHVDFESISKYILHIVFAF